MSVRSSLHRVTAARVLACLIVAGAGMRGVVAADTPLSTAITYQGQLQLNSAPVNGPQDFVFKLWDSALNGLQVSGDVYVNDLQVTNGLFTAQLDFGAGAFNGAARWLEVGVRIGSSIGPYTALAPRQPISAAPYSLYSVGGLWASNGTAISNTNAGFVGVGRSSPFGAEKFGIQSPATGSSYGGMYVRTDGAAAKPFYGYACTNGPTCWTFLDGSDSSWNLYNSGTRLTVTNTGNVGIGDTSPGAKLSINGSSSGDVLYVTNTVSGTGRAAQFYVPNTSNAGAIYAVTYGGGYAASFETHQSNSTATVSMFHNNGPVLRLIGGLNGGTWATDVPLAITGGSDASVSGGGFIVCGSVAGTNVVIDNNEVMARNNGAAATLYLNNDGGDVIIGANGTTTVKVLQVTGADVAEKFPVSDKVEPGAVVMIDAANAGKLCLSRGAYNKRVAGVISGANGLAAGTILGNLPGNEDAPPLALSGRVWVRCDTRDAAIEIGDMLTTSETPGCAMKAADHERAFGATIGKAMTPLAKGERGFVLVLINLQ